MPDPNPIEIEPLGSICHKCAHLLPERYHNHGVGTANLANCSICGENDFCLADHDYNFPPQSVRDAVRVMRMETPDA